MNNLEHCTYHPLFYYHRYILPKLWLNQPIRWCYRLLQNQLLVLLKNKFVFNKPYLCFGKSFIYSPYISLFQSLTDIDIVVLQFAIVFSGEKIIIKYQTY